MEDTFTLTRTELKGFFKCISKKFNIPYKTIALEYNAYLDSLSESENTTACSQSEPTTDVLDNTAAPVEEVVALTCVAVKKDKTVCGKKATVGDRCSIHKPKNSEKEENKPNNPEIWGVLLSPRPEPTKIVYKIEMHPRLGLYWDRTGGTRFVFSKKTGKYVAIAKYTHMTLKLSESDIQLCEKFSLPYVVTDLKDLQPEYPDQITIDGEYDRIKFELENAEFERLAREAENSIVKVPVAEVPVAEVPVVEVPTKKSGRVKNLSIDPKKFPKHRKDVKTMDIVDSLKEIIIEPELEDTIV